MKRTSLIVTTFVLMSVLFVGLRLLPDARGTTLYVGGAGPGNYTTIQAAIDDANPGDTVFAYNSTYYEDLYVDKSLSVIGEGRSTTMIEGSGPEYVVRVVADWVNITGFTVTGNGSVSTLAGMDLRDVHNCQIADNTIWKNEYGILLMSSSNNTIANNILMNNRTGIYIALSDDNVINGNEVWQNEDGIELVSSSYNTIASNEVRNNRWGIVLSFSSHHNTILNNSVHDNYEGIDILISDNNTIRGNNASFNDSVGIQLYHSANSAVVHNVVSNNWIGISLYHSVMNAVVNNSISSNDGSGISLQSSADNILSNNTMVRDGIIISGQNLEHWDTHTIDTSNTVNGKPVHYWKDITGMTVPSDAGEVILANCTDVVVENQNVSSSTVGILLGFSSSNELFNNTAYWSDVAGILLYESDSNSVRRNTISLSYQAGILVDTSSNNSINNNTASLNEFGMFLRDWANNTIVDNLLSWNSKYGMLVLSTGVHWIYHNTFINNTKQAKDDTDTNHWDNGYPSGGNYWSDYQGVDLYRGPEQNIPGSDGIGDTPYVIDSDSIDRYPLVSPGTAYPFPPGNVTTLLSGSDLENMIITWDSPRDETLGLVERYDVYRGKTYDVRGNLYQHIGSVPNGTHSFTDVLAGEGNPNTYFYMVCAVNMTNCSTCGDNQAAKFTRPLTTGPNLVSIPLIQSNETIETVLQTVGFSKAWYYDSSSREWEWFMTFKAYRRGLWSVNQTMGLWVNVTEDSNLTVAGIVPAQTAIHLYEGWNLVSFPSFNSSYTVYDLQMDTGALRVEGYDPTPPYHLRVLGDTDVLQAGEAYWVKVQADTNWMIKIS